jgi:hypothetical protein
MNTKKSALVESYIVELYNLKESLIKQLRKERDEHALQLTEYKFVLQHIHGCRKLQVQPTGLTEYFEKLPYLKHVAHVVRPIMDIPELMRIIVEAKIKDMAKWHIRQWDLTQEIASCDFVIGCVEQETTEAIAHQPRGEGKAFDILYKIQTAVR